ncbi:tetratricopeptide repeat protein [Streptomyces sp. NPDC048644]|uniref:serine/threonine-protein kinase n=1 Tax=Streptomyces sp. NPDC048644 TaxID=3365582 RepID=UPI003713336E
MADSELMHGRYRLLDRIGRGGMGEVWRARDTSLGRQVAVKCLKPLGSRRDPKTLRVLRERFRREARVAAALQHRGITVVHDFGEDDGTLFLVMELLTGRNLSQLLEDNRRHPLPVPDVIDIAEQVAAALAYTHEHAVVHRDLKPANIVRTADGTVKICDFGIARLGHDIGFTARLTGTGIAMGTPHYMSPEQIDAGTVDHRSDLYSLGCVLYEIATGAPPFGDGDAWAVLVGHRDAAPEPPRARRPELPEPYERIMLELLAKDPDDRPVDAGELTARLADARRGHHGRQPRAVQDTVPAARTRRLPSWTRGMGIGSPAGGARSPGRGGPGPALAQLTGAWTGPPSRGAGTPSAGPPQAASADTIAGLGERHDAGIGLGRLGRWDEAAAVHRAVADERAWLLGPDHPDTLEARRRTAEALARLGRHFEAHQILAAVLAGLRRARGDDHPGTLSCRHDLAVGLGRLGRLEDAYRTAREVAGARAAVLGERHPDTLCSRGEAACLAGRLGRWTEALGEYRKIADARAAACGADHPDTLAARSDVALTLGRLGRAADALEAHRELVAGHTRTHGPDAAVTLRARHGLGVGLGRLGRWEEALAEAGEVAARRATALGPGHPDTLVSLRERAVALGWLGRWDEALGLYREVADVREREAGPAHADTFAARADEAQCLERLGRTDEATALYRRAAALRRAGADHREPADRPW